MNGLNLYLKYAAIKEEQGVTVDDYDDLDDDEQIAWEELARKITEGD